MSTEPPRTSVTEYLEALIWDRIPRIERWLIDYAAAEDTPYVRAASRAMLVAAVRRARQPGCRFDQMLILEGPQGCGKSAALRLLAVEDHWFTDFVSFADNDMRSTQRFMESTAGKWIVEASELKSLESPEVNALKQCLSRQHDARQFVVVGTTSETPYLGDATGNRRFLPIHVGRFDLESLADVRDQLWAEAAVAEARGESIDAVSAAT